MTSYARHCRIMDEFRHRLCLDLGGMTVLTEAGSGHFLFSPLVAALSGAAQVIAIAPGSQYGSHVEIRDHLNALVQTLGIDPNLVRVVSSRKEVSNGIDIFLNLGFVRPIDSSLLSLASTRAVVSYMCESWEYRPGDLDLDACEALGIPVAGVDENFDGIGIFNSCGQLAIKMLFEAELEVAGCRVGILSNDPFGAAIERALRHNDASPTVFGQAGEIAGDILGQFDALIVATYAGSMDVLAGSAVTPQQLRSLNPDIRMIQFAGSFDVDGFRAAGIRCYPGAQLAPFRMAKTLAHLGPRPVIGLHAMGLKVGELLYRKKNQGHPFGNFERLVQPLVKPSCAY